MRLCYTLRYASFWGPSVCEQCPGYVSPESCYMGNGKRLSGFLHLGIYWINNIILDPKLTKTIAIIE